MRSLSSVKDIMTPKVLSVTPETPLIEAVDIIIAHHFNGLPVVGTDGNLAGIITEYDLTVSGSAIYLPTFIKLLNDFKVYKKDKSLIKGDLKKIMSMKVKDIMNSDPLTLPVTASIDDVAKTFAEHHRVNPIPIVESPGSLKIVGILSRSDMIKLFGVAPRAENPDDERQVDKNINKFLSNFENEFVFVTKSRTRTWLLFSLTFLFIGFAIAMALVLRIL